MIRRGPRSRLLPCSRRATAVCVRVEAWCPLQPVRGRYIERPHDLRSLWHYLRRVGPLALYRKVRSRMAERARNRKFAAVGSGTVFRGASSDGWQAGESVVFFAPNHPPDPRWLVVDEAFVREQGGARPTRAPSVDEREVPEPLRPYIGWSPYAGLPVETRAVDRGLAALEGLLEGAATLPREDAARRGQEQPPPDRLAPEKGSCAGRPTAVVFGLGNYAKTQIIPHVRRSLHLAAVHEIDPDQLAAAAPWGVTLDTCPEPRPEERYDAWFVAGYHHTHAPVAIEALKRGGYAVVEKPLATTWSQLAALQETLRTGRRSRFFACFQRRYSLMNDWLREDLDLRNGKPVHYHCLVYEIPLPPLHWYNWPTSGSRLTSNGCHWLDHFLFLNDYVEPSNWEVYEADNGDLAVRVELANGAFFSMTLTEHGSERLGVRDHVQLRAGEATVQIEDQTYYSAENSTRMLRRRRRNPMASYRAMYSQIVRRIVRGEPGDDPRTLRSTALTLMLEDSLKGVSTVGSGPESDAARPEPEGLRNAGA